jgi:hypothetical protein
MRYWYDTEFIERGPERPIDLVSIGIFAEDGREYYAQSIEFDETHANEWVRRNVFPKLNSCPGMSQELVPVMEEKDIHQKYLLAHKPSVPCPWRSRLQIRYEVQRFMDVEKYGEPELWGYYSAYDHVVFCQLFGSMVDLPKGFPMYTRDIKQWQDELGIVDLPEQEVSEHHALADAKWHRHLWQVLQERDILWGEA